MAVHNRLKRLPLGEASYYQIRKENTARLLPLDRAARFIYLNRFCFNGLYRTNMDGKFNVPYAASGTGALPSLDDLKKSSELLSLAHIKTGDFEDTLKVLKRGDFVYMDPPYAVKNRRIFRQYSADSFGTDDLARLASALPNIDRLGARFLVSYAMCREALEVFKGWHIRRVYTQRSISGFSKHRRKAMELLISNGELPDENKLCDYTSKR